MYEIGDIVMLWKCGEEGMTAMVITVPRHDPIYDEGTHVYRLFVGGKMAFYTGNQMVAL